jgi:hypothetical protein
MAACCGAVIVGACCREAGLGEFRFPVGISKILVSAEQADGDNPHSAGIKGRLPLALAGMQILESNPVPVKLKRR